jgi:hypothetical protein
MEKTDLKGLVPGWKTYVVLFYVLASVSSCLVDVISFVRADEYLYACTVN